MDSNFDAYLAEKYFYNKVKASAIIDLPFCKGSVMSGEREVRRFELTVELREQLNNVSRRNAANEFVIFQTALVILLYKYGIVNNVVLSPGMGTNTEEKYAGIFSTHLLPDLSVRDVIENLKVQFNDILQFKLAGVDGLVSMLQANSYDNYDRLDNTIFGTDRICTSEAFFLKQFKIAFYLLTENGYKLDIHFDRGCYDAGYVMMLGKYFLRTLRFMLENADAKLSDISIVDNDDEQLRIFNDTDITYDCTKTLLHLLDDQCTSKPGKLALRCGTDLVDFQTLDARIDAVASFLISIGMNKGDIVGVMLNRSDWLVVTILGVLKAGGVYLPVDPEYPAARTAYMVDNSCCKALICEDDSVQLPMASRQCQLISIGQLKGYKSAVGKVRIVSQPNDTAYVIYTSGSTGKPKGVEVLHSNLMNFAVGMKRELEPDSNDHLLAVTSISFDISILELVWTLCHGIQVSLNDNSLQPTRLDMYCTSKTNSVDFSLFYFSSEQVNSEDKYKLLFESARFADDNNFLALWTPERHFHEFGGIYPNPALTSAALAKQTSRIKIRSGSIVLPIHDVVRVAEDWAVIDNLSGGRAGVSIASGWHVDDFVFFPDRYSTRYEIMYDQIGELKRLWKGEKILRKNGVGKDIEVGVFPRPLQKELPIWITTSGNLETFQSAGKIGANILTHMLGQDLPDLAVKIAAYKTSLRAAGYDDSIAKVSLMLHTYIGNNITEVREIVKEPFKSYLRSSIGLLGKLAKSLDVKLNEVNEEVMDDLLEAAFERYWQTASLMGTVESCSKLVGDLVDIGVTEVACLIDFGVDHEKVVNALPNLNRLKNIFSEKRLQKSGAPVTMLQTTPSLLKLLIEDSYSHQFIGSLKKIIIGGEKLPPSLLAGLYKTTDATVYNVYGPTETTIWSTAGRMVKEHEVHVGRPIANTKIYILDNDAQIVPLGAFGEVCIAGDGLAKGYLFNEELTQEKFITHSRTKTKMYRTGDIGRWKDDGTLEIQGRIDGQIKLNGRRIELNEIETVLLEHGSIRDVAVILDEQSDSDRLIAFCVLSGDVNGGTLRSFLEERLPVYMVPAKFKGIQALPLTPNGKTDRKKLKEIDGIDLEKTASYVAPVSEVEIMLVDTWEKTLQRKEISVTDNFFVLGGDSIKAVLIISAIYKLGFRLTVRDIFQHPTIQGIAPLTARQERIDDQSLTLGEMKLTPIQSQFFANALVHPFHHNQSTILHSKISLDESLVENVMRQLQLHHDALRTTFTTTGAARVTGADLTVSIETIDLRHAADPVQELIRKMIVLQESIDLTNGPLMKTGLFRMDDGDRLLIIIHHLVVDGISWRIILEDLNRLIFQALKGQMFSLPLKTSSFKAWAERLSDFAKSESIRKEKNYWMKVASACRSTIKKDYNCDTVFLKDMTSESFSLSKEDTELLLTKANAAYKTEINDILISALTHSIRSLYSSDEIPIALEGHGREELYADMNLTRTVGWFTCIYPVVINTKNAGNLSLHIRETKEALRIVPNKGLGFGVLKYLASEEDLKLHFEPDILFNYLGQFNDQPDDSDLKVAKESTSHDISPERLMQNSLDISGMIYQGTLTLSISYSKKQFSNDTIKDVATRFKSALQDIIHHCSNTKETTFTPNDFTARDLTMAQLDKITKRYRNSLSDIYPLSPVQEGILFHVLYDSSMAYHHQMSYRIHGKLDVSAVKSTLKELTQRHEILRTRFIYEGVKKPVQVVLNDMEAEFSFDDLRYLTDEAAINQRADEIKTEDRVRGFNFSIDPLIRMKVIQLSDNEYDIVQSHHHLILDGWSAALLLAEFDSIYTNLLRSTTSPSKLRPQFFDYIKWLMAHETSSAKKYWQTYLKGFDQITQLVRTNRTEKSYDLAAELLVLTEAQTTRLGQVAASNNVTLNTLVNTIWGIVLAKYNNRRDVVFGSVVSGRPPELKNVQEMLGLFINTIPVRVKFEDGTRFLELLMQMQKDSGDSLAHHYLSLAEIQSESELVEGLLDHILVFENFPVNQSFSGSDVLSTDDTSNRINVSGIDEYLETNYDLNVVVIPVGKSITFRFSYNRNVYSDLLIRQVKTHLANVIEHAVMGDMIIDELEIITAEERQKLLNNFGWLSNNPAFIDGDFIHHFNATVGRFPDADALVTSSTKMTYRELGDQSDKLAYHLIESYDVRVSDNICVVCDRSPVLMVALLAIMKAGATMVLLESWFPDERKKRILEDSGSNVLIISGKSTVPFFTGQTLMLEHVDFDLLKPGALPERRAEIVYILYTSGSTGVPKGVEVYNSGLVNYFLWSNSGFFFDRRGFHFPLFTAVAFDLTMTNFTTLLRGDTLYIYDNDLSVDDMLRDIFSSNTRVTAVKITPSHIDALRLLKVNKSHIECAVMGGESLTRDQVSFLRSLNPQMTIFNEYGPTETTIACTFIEVTPDDRYITIGVPIANTQIYVVDQNMCLSVPGVPGELCVAGAGVAKGYFNNPSVTQAKFVKDPFGSQGSLYKTGDLGYWTADKKLQYLGRIDNQVKIRGYRIELDEVRQKVVTHPGIDEAIVQPIADSSGSKCLACFFIAKNTVDIPSLRRYLGDHLPEYMIPAYFVQIDHVPVTANGKLKTSELPDPRKLQQNILSDSITDPVERRLYDIWSEVLELKDFGPEDNFFLLGGHSLKVIQIASRIHESFNVKLELKTIFKHPTIRAQARHIVVSQKSIYEPIPALAVADYYLLSHAQKRLWIEDQFSEKKTTFNVTGASKFVGAINIAAFRSAFTALIDRHEILRTVFELVDGVPMQKVLPPSAHGIRITFKDLSKKSDKHRLVAEYFSKESKRPFALNTGPLIRAALLNIGDDEYVFVIALHHIISDAWSNSILVNDFVELYDACCNHRANLLEPLLIHYKDYAAWHNSQLEEGQVSRHSEYWKSKFSGEIPLVNLPIDFSRKGAGEAKAGSIRTAIDKSITALLKDMGAGKGHTVYYVLLAAVDALLYRYTNQNDIIVGTPVAGRVHRDLENQIGFYINTVPIRIQVDGSGSFSKLLEKVYVETVEAFDHQVYPIDMLIENLKITREANRNPLIDTGFTWNQQLAREREIQGLEVEVLPMETSAPKADIWFYGSENDEQIYFDIEYNLALFKPERIQLLADGLFRLLSQVAGDPQIKIDAIELTNASTALAGRDIFDESFDIDLSMK